MGTDLFYQNWGMLPFRALKLFFEMKPKTENKDIAQACKTRSEREKKCVSTY